jgi:hypothetical protein
VNDATDKATVSWFEGAGEVFLTGGDTDRVQLQRLTNGRIALVFINDSITDRQAEQLLTGQEP